MKRLLLNFAHFILKRYGVIPLDLKDKVMYKGTIFEIQKCTIEKEFFKTDLTLEMCDCIRFVEQATRC